MMLLDVAPPTQVDPDAAPRPADPGPIPVHVWLLPAALTLTLCVLGIRRAVLWQDELATVTAATRSLPDLARLCAHLDGVLAAYYALMHLWTSVFGVSPLAVRLPSAFAMSAAAGVTALLGARLFGRRAGLCAGLVLACLPAATWMGQEARPYATTFLLTAVATLLLVRAMERPTGPRWAAYGVGVVALGTMQLTAAVLVAAHGCVVYAQWLRHRDRRLAGWLVSTGAAVAVLAPLAYLGWRQRAQVGWIPDITWDSVMDLPGDLFSGAAVAGLVIGAALLAARRPGRLLCLAIALLPVAVLAAVSPFFPLLVPRYLLFTLLGWVLLAGAAISRAGRREVAAIMATLLVLGAAAHLQLRSTIKYDQPPTPDYRSMAEIMRSRTLPGDAIIVPTDARIRFRIGLHLYLRPDARPADVLATATPAAAAMLDSPECRPAGCLGSPPRVWVGCRGACTDPAAGIGPETAEVLSREGYVLDYVWHVANGAIALYVKATPAAPRPRPLAGDHGSLQGDTPRGPTKVP